LLDRSARSAPTPLIDGPDDDEFRRLLCIADLLRVQGVGVMYALLLVEAGVKSAAALATWEVDSLMAALTSAKPAVKGLRRLPNRREAKVWIVFAAGLPPIGA
jgi:predicted flap endonuclease-1-like 5' DNA nuclease